MNHRYTPIPAALPLLLWETPPGLERILAQEGVPYELIRDAHPLVFRGGRFVLFDSRTTSRASLATVLTSEHVTIDIDFLRQGEPRDPFAALVDTRGERGLLGRRVPETDRTRRAARQGANPPPADRPPATGRHVRGWGLDSRGPVPVSVSLGVRLSGRPGRIPRRRLLPVRRGPGTAG